jgi:hypothetical protein
MQTDSHGEKKNKLLANVSTDEHPVMLWLVILHRWRALYTVQTPSTLCFINNSVGDLDANVSVTKV